MDMSELATKMLEWEQVQKHADALRAEIEGAVLAIGKTQTVGNVRATYSAGRKSYDYRLALLEAMQSVGYTDGELAPYQTLIPAHIETDARSACKGLGIEEIPFTQSEPSVSVKLL